MRYTNNRYVVFNSNSSNFYFQVNDASKIIVEYMDENWKLEIPLATPQ